MTTFTSFDVKMAHARISAELPPDIDPTKAPLAYGERAIPKLNEELSNPDLQTRQRALMALCDVVHNPEYISVTIKNAIVDSLKILLKDADDVVRMKATEVLFIISGHAIGRDAIINLQVIAPLAELFDDQCFDVRLHAHQTIEMCTMPVPGPEGVVECGLIPILIAKLPVEEDDIKLLILDTLHRCIRVDADQALSNDAMKVLKDLLEHKKASIRGKAARDIMELCFPLKGKDSACDLGVVPSLAKLLSDVDTDVKAQAAAAIMTIAITTKGKKAALACKVLSHLIVNLTHVNSHVRLNSVKAITTLSEAPEGRAELLKVLESVSALEKDPESAAVRKAAVIATASITWKP